MDVEKRCVFYEMSRRRFVLFEGSSVNEGKLDRMLSRIETFLCPNVMRAKYVEISGYNVIIELLIDL